MDPCDGIVIAVEAGRGGQTNDWRKAYEGRIKITNNRGSPLQLPKGSVAVTLAQSSGTLLLQAPVEGCGGSGGFITSVKPNDFVGCYYWIVGPKMTSVDGGPETSILNTVKATVEVSKGVQCSSPVAKF